ncbi:hypothetical protein GGS20DRAFT_592644 [Poronia punctata]|nr:hypothetical protein GGS20DRAFT_592644 [Poronia punctata]
MGSPYEVHNFHLNIGLGDGSIHLFVDTSQKTKPWFRGTIKRAILLDGGNGGSESVDCILRVFKWINRRYDLPDGDKKLMLDAVIITHWDQDHYKTMVQLVRRCMAGDPQRVSFARYDGSGNPMTYLYVPQWTNGTKKEIIKKKVVIGEKFTGPDKYLLSKVGGDGKVYMKVSPAGEGAEADDATRDLYPEVFVLVEGTENILGRNFLSTDPLPTGNWQKDIDSPEKLVNTIPPTPNGAPGIYCVAVNGLVLGQDKSIAKKDDLGTILTQLPEGRKGGMVGIVDNPSSTTSKGAPKNIISICCMVIWKKGSGVRISHYFAGDAIWNLELLITEWVNKSAANKVAAMKISHHGSAGSTPLNMVDKFSPKSMVVSSATIHGHPRWELLMYLDAWMRAGTDRPDPDTSRLRCLSVTNYPRYLIKNKDENTNLWRYPYYHESFQMSWSAPETFDKARKPEDDDDEACLAYVERVEEYYSAIKTFRKKQGLLPLISPYEDFTKTFAYIDDKDQRKLQRPERWEWIAKSMQNRLEHVVDFSIGVINRSGAYVGANNLPGQVRYGMEFVHIRSVDDDRSDGDRFLSVHGSPEVDLYPAKRVQSLNLAAGRNVTRSDTSLDVQPKKIKLAPGGVVDDTNQPGTSGAGGSGSGTGGSGSVIQKFNSLEADAQRPMTEAGEPLFYQAPGSEQEPETQTSTVRSAVLTEVRETADDETYIVYSSDSGVATALKDGPLNDFVTSLRNGQLVLGGKPNASTDVQLLSSDEWQTWLAGCLGSATTVAARGDSDGNIVSITVAFTMADADKKDVTLRFTTSKDELAVAFDVDPDTVSKHVTAPGLVEEASMMVLALTSASNNTLRTTAADLLEMAGHDKLAKLDFAKKTKVQLDVTRRKSKRNGLWILPWQQYRTVARLMFEMTDCDEISRLLSIVDIKVTKGTAIYRSQGTSRETSDGTYAIFDRELTFLLECSVAISEPALDVTAVAEFHEQDVTVALQSAGGITLSDLLSWFDKLTGIQDNKLKDWLDKEELKGSKVAIRRISLLLNIANSTPSLTHFSIDLEVCLSFGQREPSNPSVMLFNYSRSVGADEKFGTLTGTLWSPPPDSMVLPYRKLLWDWEDYKEFVPSTPNPARRLDLLRLFPTSHGGKNVTHVPEGIPTQVAQAQISISDDGISFVGELVCDRVPDGDVPGIAISYLGLQASYFWAGKKGAFVELDVVIALEPSPSSDNQEAAEMKGKMVYDSSGGSASWQVSVYVSDLNAGMLYSLFDQESRNAVASLLDQIELKSLQLDYNYSSQTKKSSSFNVYGSLLLGPLELDLSFDYTDKKWDFVAQLKAKDSPATTVGEILNSIIPDADLPDFLANISISAPTLSVSMEKDKEAGNLVLFSVSCAVDAFEFTFVQCRHKDAKSPKRVLKASINKFPSIVVPMVGDITNMLGELYYMYVDDTSATGGLTREEAQHIDSILVTDDLPFKDTKKEGEKKPTDVVIVKGSHFVVATKKGEDKNIIIDYVFSAEKKKKKKKNQSEEEAKSLVRHSHGRRKHQYDYAGFQGHELGAKEAKQKSKKSDSNMAPFRKSVGPLSISNIGFKYADGAITLMLDAAIQLGPIGLAMLGAGISLDLRNLTLDSLPSKVKLSLQGLAAEFNKPPVQIAGLFRKSGNSYSGGLIISYNAYTIEAAGFYGQLTDQKTGKNFTSVFIFARLDGPLLEFEFIDVSGVTAGFGYNNHMNFPAIDNVMNFPFVSNTGLDPDPMTTLQTLVDSGTWFYPEDDSYWLAAGLKVDTFQVLAISAVALVKWENGALKLGIVGLGSVNIPPSSKTARFGLIELGIMVTVDFGEGVFRAESQLSSRSFILDKNCHPTGGAALCYWFAPSVLQGDWVFTIGGYHRAYKAPSHYPKARRLGISWTVSSIISITGEAYFAITPTACMAGGHLKATLGKGSLYAYFDAQADLLINYDPFHFIAESHVSVGVSYTQDLLFTSATIKGEIGAWLTLYGPPVAGRVYVDFWIFGFNIDFGPGNTSPPDVSLGDFYSLALQLKGSEAANAPQDNQGHLFTCQRGLVPKDEDGDNAAPWRVRSGRFCFSIQCRFPADSIAFEGHDDPLKYTKNKIYAKPMRLTDGNPLTSTVDVTITPVDAEEESKPPEWNIKSQTSNLPKALWGPYSPSTDPSLNPKVPALLDPQGSPCIQLQTGAMLASPDPILSDDIIAPFDVLASGAQEIKDDVKPFPDILVLQDSSWSPVEARDEEEIKDIWKENGDDVIGKWAGVFTDWDGQEEWKEGMPEELKGNFDSWYVGLPYISAC